MHTIGTLHINIQELNSRMSNFESPMTIAKYPNTSHMSKLARDIAVLQDHLHTQKTKATTTWASKLIFSLSNNTTCTRDIEREKQSLHLKLTNMEESEHENTPQLTQGFLQHMFGGTLCILETWRVGKFNIARPHLLIFKCIN